MSVELIAKQLARSPVLRRRQMRTVSFDALPVITASPSALLPVLNAGGTIPPAFVVETEGKLRVIAGEDRLAAWQATGASGAPVVLASGLLRPEEERAWFASQDLFEAKAPGSLAEALVWDRAGLLAAKLEMAGLPVDHLLANEDAMSAWQAVEDCRLANNLSNLGAPWPEVLARMGLNLGPAKAVQLVRAYSALPRWLSLAMDSGAGVPLATRITALRVERLAPGITERLWKEAVASGRQKLISSAITWLEEHPEADPAAALRAAEDLRSAANKARSRTMRVLVGIASPDTTTSATMRDLKRIVAALRRHRNILPEDRQEMEALAEELLGLLRR